MPVTETPLSITEKRRVYTHRECRNVKLQGFSKQDRPLMWNSIRHLKPAAKQAAIVIGRTHDVTYDDDVAHTLAGTLPRLAVANAENYNRFMKEFLHGVGRKRAQAR